MCTAVYFLLEELDQCWQMQERPQKVPAENSASLVGGCSYSAPEVRWIERETYPRLNQRNLLNSYHVSPVAQGVGGRFPAFFKAGILNKVVWDVTKTKITCCMQNFFLPLCIYKQAQI